MHYRIKDKLIASELAAKPPSQASGRLLTLLRNCDRVACAVDYGCGKLRYASALTAISDSLTLVDSSVQFDRYQVIDGHQTTIRQLAKRYFPSARLETISEFANGVRPKFDFALCVNVLSAIPTKSARSRALAAIRRRLKVTGSLLVVNQHTNSSYTQLARREDAVRHLDGWLVLKKNSACYYGMLDKKKTCDILKTEGYKIVEHWIEGQSNYVLARIR